MQDLSGVGMNYCIKAALGLWCMLPTSTPPLIFIPNQISQSLFLSILIKHFFFFKKKKSCIILFNFICIDDTINKFRTQSLLGPINKRAHKSIKVHYVTNNLVRTEIDLEEISVFNELNEWPSPPN
jgi:hypothetical protein